MDDGKVNALSPEMLAEIVAQFERAEKEGAIVGAHRFDVGCEQERWREMVAAGRELGGADDVLPDARRRRLQGERDRNGGVSRALCRPSRRSAGPVPNRAQLGRDRADDSVVRHRDRSPPPHAAYFDGCRSPAPCSGRRRQRPPGFLEEIVEPDRVMPAAQAAAPPSPSSIAAPTKRPRCVLARPRLPASATESTGSEARQEWCDLTDRGPLYPTPWTP
jgi:hypothetical protein